MRSQNNSCDRSGHNAAAPKNNDIAPHVPKETMEEFPDDRKDISDYFGLDDFLLRVHVTSGLQYAFDDQAVGADQKIGSHEVIVPEIFAQATTLLLFHVAYCIWFYRAGYPVSITRAACVPRRA